MDNQEKQEDIDKNNRLNQKVQIIIGQQAMQIVELTDTLEIAMVKIKELEEKKRA